MVILMFQFQSLTVRLLEDYPSDDEIEKSEQSEKDITIPIKSESIKNETSQSNNQIILKLQIRLPNAKIYFLDNGKDYLDKHHYKN